MRATAALLAALLAAPAAAAPCDQFGEALAYNACLARQGPAARAVHLGAAPAGAGARTERRASGRIAIARGHGRAEMVFTLRK